MCQRPMATEPPELLWLHRPPAVREAPHESIVVSRIQIPVVLVIFWGLAFLTFAVQLSCSRGLCFPLPAVRLEYRTDICYLEESVSESLANRYLRD